MAPSAPPPLPVVQPGPSRLDPPQASPSLAGPPAETPLALAQERSFEIDRNGRSELPASVLQSLRLFRAEPFLALPAGRHFVHLVRGEVAPAALAKSERLALFGEIEDVAIADVFSLLNMARLSGVLFVFDEGLRRGVHFRRGEIVFAESGSPEDRLGQVLYRTGKVSQEALRSAEAARAPGRRFGALLLERGAIASSDLEWGLRYQCEEIIYSIFRLTQGRFVFLRGSFLEADQATFSIDTNGILMEAYQRVDELGLIAAHIRGRETILRPSGSERAAQGLPDRLSRALALVDGRRSVEEIVRELGWGEFNTFKVLYELIQRGLVEAERAADRSRGSGEAPALAELRATIDSFNRGQLLIRDVLRAKRVAVEMASVFECFVRAALEPARSVFHGISLRSNRRLPPEILIENAHEYLRLEGTLEARRSGDAGEGEEVARVALLVRSALDQWLAHLRLLVFNLVSEGEADELASYVEAILRAGAEPAGD